MQIIISDFENEGINNLIENKSDNYGKNNLTQSTFLRVARVITNLIPL